MTTEIRSTKSYWKLPTSHMQWFDQNADGSPGPCAKWHGYDRSFHFEFAGDIDDHGWIVGFGDLKPVKAFLEYYFDHTALVSADDPRMPDILAASDAGIVDLRILPYGVSMEMTSLFIFEQVNPFIFQISGGRAYVRKIESREHDSNSAWFETDRITAMRQAESFLMDGFAPICCIPRWKWKSPIEALNAIRSLTSTTP